MSESTMPSQKVDPSLANGKEQTNGHAVPNHVAIIMDGNGRWAKHRGLPRLEGHRAGTRNVRRVLEALEQHGVQYVTLFAFSTENWSRPSDEVRALMTILQQTIERETQTLVEKNVRFRYLGRTDRLTPQLRKVITRALELTRLNTGTTLSVALDYGGRDEILQAVQQIVRDGVSPGQIDGELLQRYLYTRDIPDPDLIVRTAGEQRLSNFLIWQSVYSEYFYSPVLWPDFDEEELAQTLHAFGQRKRRFGALVPER